MPNLFSLAQLADAKDKRAAKARHPAIPAGAMYNEHYSDFINGNYLLMDRPKMNKPHGMVTVAKDLRGDYRVSIDTAKVVIDEVTTTNEDDKNADDAMIRAGQYYKPFPHTSKWKHYAPEDNDAVVPGNIGGFHACVIDTKQPDTSWTLSANLISCNLCGMDLTGPSFIAIAREDYSGWKSDPASPIMDECRGHLVIQEFPCLKTGKFRIRDLFHIPEFDGDIDSCNHPGQVSMAADSYYPILVHHDANGLVDMIKIQCFSPDRLEIGQAECFRDDEIGLDKDDIDFLMERVSCPRSVAVRALKGAHGDLALAAQLLILLPLHSSGASCTCCGCCGD